MSSNPGNDVVVAAQDLGKCYQIYAKPQHRFLQTVFRGRRQFYREFWALRGVDMQLFRGEALGIIGRNGSGKSTLLQIIAGILKPTTGHVQVQGRVAALLELGSGFTPEFTGRENVYMQGAILGLPRAQIDSRFEEILHFAGIGAFIEQPVKTYSSGMFVRLAFAVQVLLEPDILIVDEALAVGDAAFQMKCMNHMRRMLQRGVSIILVTHDVTSIRTFCHRAIWLHEGGLRESGDPAEVTASYTRYIFSRESGEEGVVPADAPPLPGPGETTGAANGDSPAPEGGAPLLALADRTDVVRWGTGEIVVEAVGIGDGAGVAVFEQGATVHISIRVRARQPVRCPDLGVAFSIRNTKGFDIIAYTTFEANHRFAPLDANAAMTLCFSFTNILAPGRYSVIAAVERAAGRTRQYFDYVENAAMLESLSATPVFGAVLPEVHMAIIETPEDVRMFAHGTSPG